MSRAMSPSDMDGRRPVDVDGPDHYEVLGVERSASPGEIKAAYRRTVKAAHPDTDGTAGLFRLVQRANDVLSDPDRRAAYDRLLDARVAEPSPADQPGTDHAAGPETDHVAGSGPDYIAEPAPPTPPPPGPGQRPPPRPGPGQRPPPFWPPPTPLPRPPRPRPTGWCHPPTPQWRVARWSVSRLALAMPVPPGRAGKVLAFVGWYIGASILTAGAPAIGITRGAASLLDFWAPSLLLLLRFALVRGAMAEAGRRRR
ncbi:MAG: J domain-containing protein [Acidimicrobiales bacterium]